MYSEDYTFWSRIDAHILIEARLICSYPLLFIDSAAVTYMYAAAIGGGVGGGVLVLCLICCVCACTIYCHKRRGDHKIEGNMNPPQPKPSLPTSTQVPSDGAKIIIIQENKGFQQPTMAPPLYYAPSPYYHPEPYPAPPPYGMGAPEQYPQSYTDPTSFPQGPPYASAPPQNEVM